MTVLIEATVAELRGHGVVFEEHTEGPLVTTNGIAQLGPALGACFQGSRWQCPRPSGGTLPG